MKFRMLVLLGVVWLAAGCAYEPGQPAVPAGPPKAELSFVDLPRFDTDSAGSMTAPLPQVAVGFVVATRNPLLLISAGSAIWSGTKALKEMAEKYPLQRAKASDAEIVLKNDDKGDAMVDKIIFSQRAP
jgi:hypothetical protein